MPAKGKPVSEFPFRETFFMPKATVSIQILPKSEKDEKNLKIIDEVIDYIKSRRVSYEVGPMETTMEGDLDLLLDIVREIQYLAADMGAGQLFSYIKIIYNPKGVMSIREKVTKHRKHV